MEIKLSNKVYDVLKWACIIGVPAVITLLSTVGEIWGFDWCPPVCLTIGAIGTCIGACIGVSAKTYGVDGLLDVDKNGIIQEVKIDVNTPLHEGDTIIFKVVNSDEVSGKN